MARYTLTLPEKNRFVGWDTVDGKSTEATRAKDLNLSMPTYAKDIFKKLAAGCTDSFGPYKLFREW